MRRWLITITSALSLMLCIGFTWIWLGGLSMVEIGNVLVCVEPGNSETYDHYDIFWLASPRQSHEIVFGALAPVIVTAALPFYWLRRKRRSAAGSDGSAEIT